MLLVFARLPSRSLSLLETESWNNGDKATSAMFLYASVECACSISDGHGTRAFTEVVCAHRTSLRCNKTDCAGADAVLNTMGGPRE